MALRLLLKKSCSQLARSGPLLRASGPAAAAAPAARPFLASRYLNTYTCPRDAVTSSCSRIGVTSVNNNHGMKSASLHPATGARRTFSSKTPTNDQLSIEEQIKESGDRFRRNMRISNNVFVLFCALYSGVLIHNRPR